MDYYFSELKPSITRAIVAALGSSAYLIKGGQAIAVHFERIQAGREARFSRDIDFSLSTASFPIDRERFCRDFTQAYNSEPSNTLLVRNVILKKMPENEAGYFGLRLSLNLGKKKAAGGAGKKVFLKDIESVAIVVDFACNEIVDDSAIFVVDGLNMADIPLIVAEKFRALCSNLHDPRVNPLPRPKDFYDLFAIYTLFYKRNPEVSVLREIKAFMTKCFDRKGMRTDLLSQLDSGQQKLFHSRNFQQQVIDTLSVESRNKALTFDQAYSESLEFLDKILGA